tara:strand:- start:28 stop:348 length:321 start_codon:yes stop_codon:yes gene_type:complete
MNTYTPNLTPKVKEIYQINDRTLGITWTDDKVSEFDVVDLRKQCPCASCVDEYTGKKILKPETIADSIRPTHIRSVGKYALTISFTDGHTTGIYTFKMLRKISKIH